MALDSGLRTLEPRAPEADPHHSKRRGNASMQGKTTRRRQVSSPWITHWTIQLRMLMRTMKTMS